MEVGNSISISTGQQWSFDNDVASHFDEHVQMSVPVYQEGHELIGFLSDFFIKEGSVFYEIGCSTGALIHKIYTRHSQKAATRFIGVEPVQNMIAQAKKRTGNLPIEYVHNTIENIDMEACDFIASYYCLQFIPLTKRIMAYEKLYDALIPGGALILFEKEVIDDSKINEMIESCYLKFKLSRGFSVDEIIAKKFSLEGMMRPCTERENRKILAEVGFKQIATIMKYGEFHGYLCIK